MMMAVVRNVAAKTSHKDSNCSYDINATPVSTTGATTDEKRAFDLLNADRAANGLQAIKI